MGETWRVMLVCRYIDMYVYSCAQLISEGSIASISQK